jgi:hypothetical protein
MSHFSAKTLRALSRKGITVVGLQAIPDMSSDMPFANAETGFLVNDNGCGKVWTFRQVLEAAK